MTNVVKPVAADSERDVKGFSKRPSIRHVGNSALISIGLRFINVASSLIAMALTTSHFGVERFAVWATILSLEALLTFADLGLANALVSAIAGAHDESSRRRARTGLSCALAATSGIAAILILLAGLGYAKGILGVILGVDNPALADEANLAVGIYILCTCLRIPIGVFEKVQTALHRAHVAAIWRAGTAIGQLAILSVGLRMNWSMPACVLGFSSIPVCLCVLQALTVMKQHPGLRPSPRLLSLSGLRTILRSGSQYLVIQGAMAVVVASDQVILLHESGPIEAARYAVPARIVLALPALMMFALLPAWPAYAAASAQGDILWIRRTNRLVLAAIMAIGACSIAAVQLVGPALLEQWTPHAPIAGRTLLFGLSVWAVALLAGIPVGMLLAGLDRLMPLALCTLATAMVGLPLKVWMAQLFGASGVAWASVVAYGCCLLVPSAILIPRLLDAFGSKWLTDAKRDRGSYK